MIHLPLFEPPPPKALTVRQPWAHLIMAGLKTIENRTWQTNYRGVLYIHAGSRMHETPLAEINRRHKLNIEINQLQFGAIIGRVELVDIVSRSDNPYFTGPYGWILENPEALEPIPLRGKMGLFDLPAGTIEKAARRA